MKTKKIKFTPKNLIKNIKKLGAWSVYGLASEALQYYFPDEYDEHDFCESKREVELLESLGCNYWQDVVIKYQKEIGYKSFCDGYVNEY